MMSLRFIRLIDVLYENGRDSMRPLTYGQKISTRWEKM